MLDHPADGGRINIAFRIDVPDEQVEYGSQFVVELKALTNIVDQAATIGPDITTETRLRSYLLDIVWALSKDTGETDLDGDIILHIVNTSLRKAWLKTSFILGSCTLTGAQVPRGNSNTFTKALGLHVSLPAGDKFVIFLDKKKKNKKSKAPVLKSIQAVAVFALDVGGRTVKEIREQDDDPLKPAITQRGSPCMDCITSLKKSGDRCWRKQHKIGYVRQSVDELNQDPLKPAITKNGSPCKNCVKSLEKTGKRCWREQHKVGYVKHC